MTELPAFDHVLLRGADPGHAATPCHTCGEPAMPGRFFVGLALTAPGRAGFLCRDCARAQALELSNVAEALNLLYALAPDLNPGQHAAFTGALEEITQRLSAPQPAGATKRGPTP